LIQTAAGIREDDDQLASVLNTDEPHVLNRVLNLETGSLAVEAGIKMMLSRFYKIQADGPATKYTDRIPVFLVMGDMDGGTLANYHGTTIVTQIMRGMWRDLGSKVEACNGLAVRGIKPNDLDDLKRAFGMYNTTPYKVAGFLHEIVLMNYAAFLLNREFMTMAYDLCHTHDVPVLVDEIQSCIWSPEIFMYREYDLHPDFVAVGKGMPGGEYAASRILFSSHMDTMAQFGALVTNGQEELAALAYLVTMRWARENAEVTSAVGQHYEDRVHELARKYPDVICAVEGRRHMIGIYFYDLDHAKTFALTMAAEGMDVSVQTYKAGCPPSALTKLPLISGYEVVDFVMDHMSVILEKMLGRSAVMIH